MKTIVSVLGLFLLVGAVALAQTSSTGSTSSQSAVHDRSAKSSVQAGNSGFDTDSSTPAQPTSSSSASMDSKAGSSSATSSSSGQSSYGSSSQSAGSDSIANGPVAETVADSSALIGWATRDAASGSAVKYGTSRTNMVQSADATDGSDGKNHHARLQGLSPNTRYYFPGDPERSGCRRRGDIQDHCFG